MEGDFVLVGGTVLDENKVIAKIVVIEDDSITQNSDSSDSYSDNHGISDVYDMCDYLYGVKGTPEDFFYDVGLPCYTSTDVDGTTIIRISEDDYSVQFHIYEYMGETRYLCNTTSMDYMDINIAGFNLSMSYNEVIQILNSGIWDYSIEGDLIIVEYGECDLYISLYQGSLFGIEYREKAGYWYENYDEMH